MFRPPLWVFVSFVLGLLINSAIYISLPQGKECSYRFGNGDIISGNCTWIKKIKSNRLDDIQLNFTYTPSNCIAVCPKCEPCRPCERCQICTLCEQCKCNITECLKQSICVCKKIEDRVYKEALEYKPMPNSLPGYQSGGYDSKDFYLELFDVPNRSRFKSRPSIIEQLIKYNSTNLYHDNLTDTVNNTPTLNGIKPKY